MHSSSSSSNWISTTAWAGLGLLFGCCWCCLVVVVAAACLQLPFMLYARRKYYEFMLAVWTTEPYPYVLFGYLLWCVNHWTSTLYAISDFQLPMCYISCFLVHIIQKQPNSGQLKKRLTLVKLRLSGHCSKLWPSAPLTLTAFLNIGEDKCVLNWIASMTL